MMGEGDILHIEDEIHRYYLSGIPAVRPGDPVTPSPEDYEQLRHFARQAAAGVTGSVGLTILMLIRERDALAARVESLKEALASKPQGNPVPGCTCEGAWGPDAQGWAWTITLPYRRCPVHGKPRHDGR